MTTRIHWLDLKRNEISYPIRNKDGYFVLGDPKAGKEKHHEKNQVLAKSEDVVINLLRLKYSIRVKTDSAPSLVCKNLYIDGIPLD